jgi:hypothetical protein
VNTWARRILRRLYGLVVEQVVWRIRTNEKLRKLYKYIDIVADIKKNVSKWLEHLVRVVRGKIVKKIFESKPEGRRIMGKI